MILGFDTSGAYISVAVCDGARGVAAEHIDMAKGQAETLFPKIEQTLSKAGLSLQDICKIGVGIGPGNFTGARISVAAARGLARSLGVPVIGISLLEAVAHGADQPILACLGAPKGKAYIQGFGTSVYQEPVLVEVEALSADLGLACIGSAAVAVAERIGGVAHAADFRPAVAIAQIAADRDMSAPPSPLYLRDADAAPSRIRAPVLLT